ncbi:hypothetical protein DRO31_02715 [Candidatus Bathyarchaeota archaeon]|nr:MAG: hypothetical protein DRO31_02715 [Candidatus Bathyarchaeota archaeon]
MPEEKLINKDEVRGLLLLVLLFVSVVGGRQLGNYYASYQEMTQLKVLFEVTEEELSRYINSVISGENSDLEVGIVIASPTMDNSAGIVTSTPDYVNRWLIGLTVSPLVVNQPEASEVELEMLIEETVVDEALYDFPKEKISFIAYTDRMMSLDIEDLEAFKSIIETSVEEYGGEVKVTFRGQVHMHLLFLDTWLPYEVTRYPIVSAPYLRYVDSDWVSYTEGSVLSMSVDEGGYVVVDFRNPTRLHSLSEEVTCQIFSVGEDEPVLSISKTVSVPPSTDGQYTFSFRFEEPGDYVYLVWSGDRLLVEGEKVLSVE